MCESGRVGRRVDGLCLLPLRHHRYLMGLMPCGPCWKGLGCLGNQCCRSFALLIVGVIQARYPRSSGMGRQEDFLTRIVGDFLVTGDPFPFPL